jgi:DNA-binding NarL/FixJ family response regulator
MTATPSREQRIARMFAEGHSLNFVAERGLQGGWTRLEAIRVVYANGWKLTGSGRLDRSNLPAPVLPKPKPKPKRPPRAHIALMPKRTGAAREIPLTARQQDVLRELLVDGASDSQIARRLGVTLQTVKTHWKHIYRRAGIHDRCALAIAVMRGDIRVTTTDTRRAA